MATDIVQSLFGVTPEAYQRSQDALAEARALKFAELDPMARATYGIYRGAGQLGGALGRALGGEDPELARISMRQSLAQQIDFNDPASIQAGVQQLSQAGDTRGAMMLADTARKASSEIALARQRGREGAAKSPLQELLRTGKYTPESMATYGQTGDVAQLRLVPSDRAQAFGVEREAIAAELYGKPFSQLTQAEIAIVNKRAEGAVKGPGFGTDREAVAAEMYDNKTFAQLTPAEKAAVNKRVEEAGKAKAKAGAAILGGPGKLAEIAQYTSNLQATMKAPLETVDRVDNALGSINDAITTGNFASYSAARTQFAKAVAGAGDLSQRELKAAGADPSLLGGAQDYLSSLATSTPSADTMKKMRSAMEVLRKVNVNKATAELERQKKIAVDLGYPAQTIDVALQFPQLRAAPTGGAPGGDLAAQAAAELARRRQQGGK